ncbi:MAG: recombination-associated protein RdgC [Lentisphaeria bacterium]|nr:recombination-associated protein RdgC [Lentisphaeria bacterium]
MGFDVGSISMLMCKVNGEIPDDLVERFQKQAAYSLETVEDEPQVGWVTGRHLLDTKITEETAYTGGYLHMQLRKAMRKVPGALLKAECKIEELALMQAMNTIALSRKQKKEIREDVTERLIKTMPPTISGTAFVLDTNHNMLYLGATSMAAIDMFTISFYETTGIELMPLYPEIMAEEVFQENVMKLHQLSIGNTDYVEEEQHLGRDFLTWLWYFKDVQGGQITHNQFGEFGIFMDGPLQFMADGPGAMESVVRKGFVQSSAEAKTALQVGKKLTRARVEIQRDKESWNFVFDADNFTFRSLKLPDGEELDPQSHFQERVLFLNILREVFYQLFDLYLQEVNNGEQAEKLETSMRDWIEEMKVY